MVALPTVDVACLIPKWLHLRRTPRGKAPASEEEVTEIKVHWDRVRPMGFQPIHLDTYMSTAYNTPDFLKGYIQIGIRNHCPVLLPGGADRLIQTQTKASDAQIIQMRALGKMLWDDNRLRWNFNMTCNSSSSNSTRFYLNKWHTVDTPKYCWLIINRLQIQSRAPLQIVEFY